ncbi:MAG: penicillin-binding protein 2 [Gammaproteobacteria bacterium]
MKTIQDLRKDEKDAQSLRSRSGVIFSFLLILIIAGIFKIIQLTVLDRVDYVAVSDKNRIINIPIYPARGLIKLEDGTIIAENIVTKGLYIERKLFDTSRDQIEKLYTQILDESRAFDDQKLQIKNEEKIWLVRSLSQKELAKYEVHKNSMPSIKLEAKLRRYLPHRNLFSHVVGHLGLVSKDEMLSLSRAEYLGDSYIGKVGLEKSYEELLKGMTGTSLLEVDVYGNKVREIQRTAPDKPSNITLTLDFKLQKIAQEELANRRGAVVALDPMTGFIKVLVSSPDYNPNILNGSENGLSVLQTSMEEAPFFNRAISGLYPPASTIKPFIGLLGLEEKIINETTIVEDKGFFQLSEEGRKYRGWKEDGHGKVNLNKAIVESSDVYFYELASKLTIDRISSFLLEFGFGEISGIDLTNESKSILPTRNWKLGNIGEAWFVGDTINIGIGQGYISSTPLQLAVSLSAIANKGKIFKPKLISHNRLEDYEPQLLMEVQIQNPRHWNIIEKSMVSVINAWNGTAHNLYDEGGITIAGKTGTAQIKSLTDQDLSVREEYEGVRKDIRNRDHALFASYGPIPDPNLVVVVIVENGESGSAVAAPIAKRLIEQYQINLNES